MIETRGCHQSQVFWTLYTIATLYVQMKFKFPSFQLILIFTQTSMSPFLNLIARERAVVTRDAEAEHMSWVNIQGELCSFQLM